MRREGGGEWKRGGGLVEKDCKVRDFPSLCMFICMRIPSHRETGGRPLSLRRNKAGNVGGPHICLPRAMLRLNAGTVDPGAKADAPTTRATIKKQTLGMVICSAWRRGSRNLETTFSKAVSGQVVANRLVFLV